MAAALAAEGAEGAEASGGFSEDSGEGSKSVDVGAIIKGGLSLAGSVVNLVSAVMKGNEAIEDVKNARYAAGILTTTENRDDLLNQGLIPAYYSEENIRRLIREDKFPIGWSLTVLVGQGFGIPVEMQQKRQRGRQISKEANDQLDRDEKIRGAETALKYVKQQRATRKLVSGLKASVV